MPFIFATTQAQEPASLHQIHLPAAWEFCEGFLGQLYDGDQEVNESYSAFAASVQQAYLEGTISANDTARIIQATQFAALKHQGQMRKNEGESHYIIHPIGVANHLMNVGEVRDADILIAALLHDTVEDTNTSFEEIKKEFGAIVEGYVRELTDDKSLPGAERKRLQIENASHKSAGAAMVKLGDKHYNLTDLSSKIPRDGEGKPWSQERIDAYFVWAKQVVDGLPQVNPALKQAVDDVIAAHR